MLFLLKKRSYAGYKDCFNYGVYDEVVSLSHERITDHPPYINIYCGAYTIESLT
jgi:hypothetical protein